MDRKYNFFARIEFIFGYYEYLGQNTPSYVLHSQIRVCGPIFGLYSPPLPMLKISNFPANSGKVRLYPNEKVPSVAIEYSPSTRPGNGHLS